MEIWKNKRTGKGFIYIEDTGQDEALFVTPLGEIKSLQKSLFKELTTEDESTVSELQKQRCREYEKQRKENGKARFFRYLDTLTPYQVEELKKASAARRERRDRLRRKFDQEDSADQTEPPKE
jgi:hypothetical protein